MGIHTLSDSIGESGGAFEWISASGDKYKVSLLTLEKQSRFERSLERRALESVKNSKPILDKEDYDAALARTLEEIAEGAFCFGGEKSSKALSSFWGICNLLAILLNVEPDKAGQLIQENDEITSLVEMVVTRSFPVAAGKANQEKEKNQTGLK